MTEQPIDVLVQNYKDADQRYIVLLMLKVHTFPPSTARRHGLPVLNEKARQEAKAAYQRLSGEEEYDKVQRLRESLRREVAERLAQRPTYDPDVGGSLQGIGEYIEVNRKSAAGVQNVGKVPRLGGKKAVIDILGRWFGPGDYELDYVRDGVHEGHAPVTVRPRPPAPRGAATGRKHDR